MSLFRSHRLALPVALILFILAFAATFPFYRYAFDGDSVAYLTIARRWATGDYANAVNGLWSPLHGWIVARFVKMGYDPYSWALYTNAFAAAGCLAGTSGLFRRFKLEPLYHWIMLPVLAIVLVYCTYFQVFADLWEYFLLLLYLNLVLLPSFSQKWGWWLLTGVVAALAYLAKAYAFYFILLHLPISLYLLLKEQGHTAPRRWMLPTGVVYAVMTALSMPWILALHHKYGGWMLSTAGKLNSSWYLMARRTYKPELDRLLPPPYADSPTFWEDPWFVEGQFFSMFGSLKLFIKQILRSGYTVFQALECYSFISPLLLPLVLFGTFYLLGLRFKLKLGAGYKVLFWAMVINVIGYLKVHMEARYVWLTLFCSLVVGAMLLQLLFTHFSLKPLQRLIITGLFACTYLIHPVMDMETMVNKGKGEYELAQQVNQLGIQGRFTANPTGMNIRSLAYLTSSQLYEIEYYDFDHAHLLQEMRRYQIPYYWWFHSPQDADGYSFTDETGRPCADVTGGHIPGLKIFKLN
jgi:hypothetical protein